jgi:V/A-type H+-transporting ATPase subunit I
LSLPEKVARFRAAAPAEQEVALLNAIISVGSVHLESELGSLRSALPELLVDVLEGRVNYANLNVDEALEVARKVLRPEDPFLLKLEDKVKELRQVEFIEKILDKLGGIGVSPDSFGKQRLGVITDFMLVTDENVHDAISELVNAGIIVRRARVSPEHHIVIMIYSTNKSQEVDAVKKKYSLGIQLPQWFFEPLETAKRRAEEEKTRIKKEIIETLVEIAGVLRDAFEFERATRIEIISNTLKAIENAEKNIQELERLFTEVMAFNIVHGICRKRIAVFEEIGLKKPVCELLRNILNNEKVSRQQFRKLLAHIFSQEELDEIENDYTRLLSLQSLYNALGTLKLEELAEKSVYVVASGGQRLEEVERPEYIVSYGYKIINKFADEDMRTYIFSVPEETSSALVNYLRDRLRAQVIVVPRDSQAFNNAQEQLAKSLETVKNSLLTTIVSRSILKTGTKHERILSILNNEELKKAYSYISQLKNGVPQRGLPEGDIYSYLKSLTGLADETSEEISHLREEIEFVKEVPYEKVTERLRNIERSLVDVSSKLVELLSYKSVVETMFRAQPLLSEIRVFRSRRITVVEGYVPVKYVPLLEQTLKNKVPRLLYFKYFEIPRTATAPTYVERKGLKKYLYTLTSMRGTPAYWEVDPTLIFTGLFILMYGMMFGDIGQGLVLLLFGAFMWKTKYRLLGITREGAATLGVLSMLAGLSSMVFGYIYGSMFFLMQLGKPIIAPIHDVYGIIAVALWFGVAQLTLAFILNIVNLWMYGDKLGALFSGMGGAGLAFYGSGVAIAYKLATSGFNLAILSSPELAPFISVLIIALLSVVGYGMFEALHHGEKEKLMHAISEVIEMIIAFPSNSLSYIRLAAFAMAHEAFGILAENLASFTGPVASYIVANFLVLGVEALAVGIQAMRLTYYEFSTKFFKGTGVEFEPIASTFSIVEKNKSISK